MTKSRWAFTIVSFLVMFGASAWVVATNWPTTGLPSLALSAHLAALLTVTLDVLSRALKTRTSAMAVGLSLRFSTALRVCLGGDFAASITPARSGAEPARFLVLGESGMAPPGRVLVLFLELLLEMLSLTLVCIVLAIAFRGRGASIGGLLGLVGGYSSAVLGAGAFGLLLAHRNAHGPPPGWARRLGLHAGRWRAVQRTLRSLRGSVQSLRSADPALMLAAFGGSVIHVMCKVATLPFLVFLGDPSFRFSMDHLAPLVLWPLALFYGGAVVPAPGGGGAIEGAFAATLKDAIPAGIFAASLIWWRFYTFYLYMLAGAVAAGDASMRAIRRRSDLAERAKSDAPPAEAARSAESPRSAETPRSDELPRSAELPSAPEIGAP